MQPPSPCATTEARRTQSAYCQHLLDLAEQLRIYPFLHDEVESLTRIAHTVVEPFSVAVFGRMKTGKSSLINALIGKPLAITGVDEATATINRLCYAVGEALSSFTVHWHDEAPSQHPLEELACAWTGTGEDVLERVQRAAWIDLYADAEMLKDVSIIDTPGTGSTASEHEQIAQQFISGQQTDALIYVFSPVGRESDAEALASFATGTLATSTPYNSVAVLHKWDHIYWDNGGDIEDIQQKAHRIYQHMRKQVSSVLPVSAPLSLLTQIAPASFWSELLELLASFSSETELTRALSRDGRWNREERQAALYSQVCSYELPWASFQIMLREIYRHSCSDAGSARRCIHELSGMTALRVALDREFFKQSVVIRQLQTRARAQRILTTMYGKIEEDLISRCEDLSMMQRISGEIRTPALSQWWSEKREQHRRDYDSLRAHWLAIDQQSSGQEELSQLEYSSYELQKWLHASGCPLPEDMRALAMRLMRGSENRSGELIAIPSLQQLLMASARLAKSPDRPTVTRAKELQDHINQYIKQHYTRDTQQ